MSSSLIPATLDNSSKKKKAQLGMVIGTATARLKKNLLFDFVRKLNQDICIRCGERIESVEEFSVDHILPWLDNDVNLFWNLENIGFSHLLCNCADTRKILNKKHPSVQAYRVGCRCDECKELQKIRMRKYRKTFKIAK